MKQGKNNFLKRKAQAALEFTLLTFFLLAIGGILLGIFGIMFAEFQDNKLDVERDEFVEAIREEISLAMRSENAYYREVEISNLDLEKYNITFYENTSYLTIKDNFKDRGVIDYAYDLGGLRFNQTFFYEVNSTTNFGKIIINRTKSENLMKVEILN